VIRPLPAKSFVRGRGITMIQQITEMLPTWLTRKTAALAIPASTIAGALIPIAYYTFFLLMNSKTALGEEMPTGARRIRWNGLMILATGLVSFGAIWVTYQGVGTPGLKGIMSTSALIVLAILFVLGTLSFLKKNRV